MVATIRHQIKIKDGKVLLRIPDGLTELPSIDEIQEDLNELDVDYSPEILLEIYERQSGKFEVLCEELTTEYQFIVEISHDEQEAFLTVVPPIGKQQEDITIKQLENALEEAGVYEGISYPTLHKIMNERIYHEPVTVAQGKTVVDGKKGFVEILVGDTSDPERHQKDIRDINLLEIVEAGEPLVSFVPPLPGSDGFTVTGKIVDAKVGKKARIYPGKGTSYNRDHNQILATCAGFVSMNRSSLVVEPLYEVERINRSVGNIRFDGILRILGDIEDGVLVEATTRIEVYGSIGKARLQTHGDLQVKGGIKGAKIRIGGTLKTLFIEDSKIETQGNVVVDDYILNSHVFSGKMIHVVSPKGSITGGMAQAGNFIKVPHVGSKQGGITTTLEVGISIKNRKEFIELEESMSKNMISFIKLKKNMLILQKARAKHQTLPEEHEAMYEQLWKMMGDGSRDLKEKFHQWRSLAYTMHRDRECKGGLIFIEGEVSPGTVLHIRRLRHVVETSTSNTAFFFTNEGLQARPYDELYTKYQRFLPRK